MAKELEQGGASGPGSQNTTKREFSFTTPHPPLQGFWKLRISSDGKGMDGKGIGRRRRPRPWIAKHNKMRILLYDAASAFTRILETEDIK